MNAEELRRERTPVWDSLKDKPPLLVAVLQVVTDLHLRCSGNHDETGGWV